MGSNAGRLHHRQARKANITNTIGAAIVRKKILGSSRAGLYTYQGCDRHERSNRLVGIDEPPAVDQHDQQKTRQGDKQRQNPVRELGLVEVTERQRSRRGQSVDQAEWRNGNVCWNTQGPAAELRPQVHPPDRVEHRTGGQRRETESGHAAGGAWRRRGNRRGFCPPAASDRVERQADRDEQRDLARPTRRRKHNRRRPAAVQPEQQAQQAAGEQERLWVSTVMPRMTPGFRNTRPLHHTDRPSPRESSAAT